MPKGLLEKNDILFVKFGFFSCNARCKLSKYSNGIIPCQMSDAESATWRQNMTGRHKGTLGKVGLPLLACVLLSFAILFLLSCVEQQAGPGGVGNIEITPVEKTEDGLLAELDHKFENPYAHYQLGRLYHKQHRWDKAEYHYNLAVSFDPAHRAAQAALVKLYADSGDKAKADQFARADMNQVANSAKQSLKLARAFENEQLYEYALVCFEQALRLGPHMPEVSKYFGYYYLNRGDEAQAKKYLSRSFELNPNQPDVAGALGRLGIAVEVPDETIERQSKPKGST
jgi:predicted Zn-dependent protease